MIHTSNPTIELLVIPGNCGDAPMVRACINPHSTQPDAVAEALKADTDAAMVARAMLTTAAYLFAQGQPVTFGDEIPREILK
jgi:hypothetical protein